MARKCAFCCGSNRFSTSSVEDAMRSNSTLLNRVSSISHMLVQERLDGIIGEGRDCWKRRKSLFVILVAVSKNSFHPREDFRESMMEVIVSRGMKEPKELRRLLNCYLSVNLPEHRYAILEAFHEVCAALFRSG